MKLLLQSRPMLLLLALLCAPFSTVVLAQTTQTNSLPALQAMMNAAAMTIKARIGQEDETGFPQTPKDAYFASYKTYMGYMQNVGNDIAQITALHKTLKDTDDGSTR
ncbi:unnamed protein product [Amoebophrya sp. A120]|nr:unnamed protein product [Amoebophrya sp. A120]|eukprot:GSA120T00011984001.1